MKSCLFKHITATGNVGVFGYIITAGLLRRGREAPRHRATAEGRDRGADRGGPAAAPGSRRSFLLLEQQREACKSAVNDLSTD